MADFSKTWEKVKGTIKTFGNDALNSIDKSSYISDSTKYVNDIQPVLYPKSKTYIPPAKDVNVGEKLADGNTSNYNEAVEIVERLQRQPYRPKYKTYFK